MKLNLASMYFFTDHRTIGIFGFDHQNASNAIVRLAKERNNPEGKTTSRTGNWCSCKSSPGFLRWKIK